MERNWQDTKHGRGRILLTASGADEHFVPKSDYDAIVLQLAEFKDTADRILEENRQLKEVLKNMNVGITKASDLVEGIAWIKDQVMITNLAIDLLKKHPNKLTIKYRGDVVTEIIQQ